MLKKKKRIWLVIILVVVLGGYLWYSRSKNPDEGIEVEKVVKSDVAQTVSVTGELVPVEYADLSFVSTGTIADILVKEGDEVKRGDVIATLDLAVLESQMREADIALQIAIQNEWKARRDRFRNLITKEEMMVKKLATEEARENIRTLQAQLKQRKLIAPIDGYVSRIDARVGETAAAGATLVRISSGAINSLEAQIPESDIAELRIGMEASVTFDALTKKDRFTAIVSDIDPVATVIQDVVSYKVKFVLSSSDQRLREGMTADIDIEVANARDVLAVPFRAVSKDGEKSFVEIHRGPGQYERVEVSLGLEGDEGMIEVKSGLIEGDEVVVSRK